MILTSRSGTWQLDMPAAYCFCIGKLDGINQVRMVSLGRGASCKFSQDICHADDSKILACSTLSQHFERAQSQGQAAMLSFNELMAHATSRKQAAQLFYQACGEQQHSCRSVGPFTRLSCMLHAQKDRNLIPAGGIAAECLSLAIHLGWLRACAGHHAHCTPRFADIVAQVKACLLADMSYMTAVA